MPAITSGKVLVTGANGYIATWLVKDLLEQGFSVRGTVRSLAKGDHLKKIFASYGDKLELVVVEDITKDGAFDEAVKDVDAIQHTASPFHFAIKDPQELILPAVAGTESILRSALKYGTNIKRVVILSSTAAIQDARPDPAVYTEKDWNESAITEVETKGAEAGPINAYMASKTLAEKAAWKWYEQNKAQVKWDMTVLNPPFVFGPILHEIKDVAHLNTSMVLFYTFVLKGDADAETLATQGQCWADVRDVTKGLVLGLLKEQAGGERIILGSGPYMWQDWVNAARKSSSSISAGNTAYKAADTIYPIDINPAKSVELLGMKYRTMDETARDILEDFAKKGW
ncbi:hypothetical protein QCA50_004090 [Cerrena zonata]|uniref:NAD-dependent epimerase/dehydratase domain-containing protein n=1 Tax=Cerrena zonata TaxID=2478898 RepID=A0AAW0GMZ7_9APHY